jgi:hypothetical protein
MTKLHFIFKKNLKNKLMKAINFNVIRLQALFILKVTVINVSAKAWIDYFI